MDPAESDRRKRRRSVDAGGRAARRRAARVRTLGGTRRGAQRVGPIARGTVGSPTASLSKHRGELVGWLSQAVHEGDAGPGIVYAGQARDGGSGLLP